jgi:uncharacterized protein (DUF488 family)
MPPRIYTVGHSTHTLELLLELLRGAGVDCVADLRSIAASSYNPQFNLDALKAFLSRNGIRYLSFGEEFGARRTNPAELDEEGCVDFAAVRATYAFRNGIDRLWELVHSGLVVALLCAESEPLECHRFSMVSVALVEEGFDVLHIMKDGTLRTHAAVEADLLHKYRKKLPVPDLFTPDITRDDQLRVAYRLVNRDIGYRPAMGALREGGYD